MSKKLKLKEAKFFYAKLLNEKNKDVETFSFYLSAFLSAIRSVIQYILTEVEKTPKQKWYADYVKNNNIILFFKDKRDINIHVEPIHPDILHEINISEYITLSDKITIIKKDKDGNVIEERTSEDEQNIKKPDSTVVSGTKYLFDDWNYDLDKDVLKLCKRCIQETEKFLDEGIQKGFITE